MDVQPQVEEVKRELAELIVTRLKSNQIELDVARKLAQEFLALLPIKDIQDLLLKLKNLSGQYEEARIVYMKEVGKIQETKRHEALSQMHALIESGNIEQAIALVKQAQKVD